MIDGDFAPLRSSSTTQAERFRHGYDPAQLGSGYADHWVSFSHLNNLYSMAIPAASSAAIPGVALDRTKCAMTLGDKIRAARLAARKTQDQVAEKLGLTKGAISQWENDGTIPELQTFMDFCKYTGASADEILLDRDMDPLLRQLILIWEKLSSDGRDTLLGNANRLLTEEHPEPGPHNPFGSKLQASRKLHQDGKQLKPPKKGRLS